MEGTSRPTVDVLGQVLAQRSAVAERLQQVGRVLAIASGKGGVGKSLLTANLAVGLAGDDARVGVLDADLHGASAALMLGARGQRPRLGPAGVEPAVGVAGIGVMSMDLFLEDDDAPARWRHYPGLGDDSYVWRGTLEANVLRELLADTAWGELDYLLIDMPPGADRFETLLRLVPDLAGTLLVTTPGQASLLVVRRAAAIALQAGARIVGLIENMAGSARSAGAQQLADDLRLPLLASIPFDPELGAATEAGRPGILAGGESPARVAIRELVEQVRAGTR
jgi:ATP-binding protein involved in chromosome partitioning